MYETFTDRARKIMMLANQEAQRFNHEYIGTEHILLGLVKEGSGVAAHVLKMLGIDLRKVRMEVEKLTPTGPEMMTLGKLPQTPRAKKVIEYAMQEARGLQHSYVGTEHILLGLLRESEGVAAQVLTAFGLTADALRADVLTMLGLSPTPLADAIAKHLGDHFKKSWAGWGESTAKPEEAPAPGNATECCGPGESCSSADCSGVAIDAKSDQADESFPLTTDEMVRIIANRARDFTRDQLEKAGIKRNVHVLIIPVGYSVDVRAPASMKQKDGGPF